MPKSNVEELETLIEQIPDPLLRAKEGMNKFSPGSEQSKKYFLLYIQTLINDGGTYQEFRYKDIYISDHLDLLVQAFERLPEDRRPEIIRECLLRIFDQNSMISYPNLELIASLAKKIEFGPYVLTIILPYINDKFAFLQGKSDKTDNTALTLIDVAKKFGLVNEIKEVATQYFQRRLERIKDPTSTDAFSMINLFEFVNTYGLPEEGELTDIYLATSLFTEDRLIFANDTLPKITKENEEKAIEQGWQIAQNLWRNIRSATGLEKLVSNKMFQAKYCTDETARAIAKDVVAKKLNNNNIEEAISLVDIYNLSGLDEIVNEGIRTNLQKGNYQAVSQIAKIFGYTVTNEMYDSARKVIERQLSDDLKGDNSDKRYKAKLRLRFFDEYRLNGLDIESIPRFDVPRVYIGKVILLEYQGMQYVRTIPNDGLTTYDIVEALQEKLMFRGFLGSVREIGEGDVNTIIAGNSIFNFRKY